MNNAGGQLICSAEDMSSNGFNSVVQTSLIGTFHVRHAAFTHHMKDMGVSSKYYYSFQNKYFFIKCCFGNCSTLGNNGMPYAKHVSLGRGTCNDFLSKAWSDTIDPANVDHLTYGCMANKSMFNSERCWCLNGIVYTDSDFANYGSMGGTFLERYYR